MTTATKKPRAKTLRRGRKIKDLAVDMTWFRGKGKLPGQDHASPTFAGSHLFDVENTRLFALLLAADTPSLLVRLIKAVGQAELAKILEDLAVEAREKEERRRFLNKDYGPLKDADYERLAHPEP